MPRSGPVPVIGTPALAGSALVIVGIQAEDQAQQRRLAAAAGADDADELAWSDVEIDACQHLQHAAGRLLARIVLGQPRISSSGAARPTADAVAAAAGAADVDTSGGRGRQSIVAAVIVS